MLWLCDRSGPPKYNKNDLATRRIKSVRQDLIALGVPAGQVAEPNIVTISAVVEQKPGEKVRDGDNIGEERWAVQDKPNSTKDGALRIAEIVLDGNDADYVFVTGDAGTQSTRARSRTTSSPIPSRTTTVSCSSVKRPSTSI